MPTHCPNCAIPLLPPGEVQSHSGLRRACAKCAWVEPDAPKPPTERKLEHLHPGIQDVKEKRLEAAVQAEIVRSFRAMNWLVMETSERRVPVACPRCSHQFTPSIGRPGVTIGLPDLFVRNPRHDGRFSLLWFGLEVKGSETAVSPQQQALAEGGHIEIVKTWAEALRAVGEVS